MATQTFYGTGRRKCAVARVRIREGSGQTIVNGRNAEDYFGRATSFYQVVDPLNVAGFRGKLDVLATVRGGGETGQAGALRHGLSRALLQLNPECREHLKRAGYLTRDARVKERKKYGQPGARKRYQYSKR